MPGLPTLLSQHPSEQALLHILSKMWDFDQRVRVIGQKAQGGAGSDVNVRFLASLHTEHVQQHVQSDAVGEGGADYDAVNYTSTARIDCRTDRQQDITISRNGTNHYYLFLIPVLLEGGSYLKFDGIDVPEDQMTFIDLGI